MILPSLVCLPWPVCPGIQDTVTEHPLKGTVRIFSWRRRERATPHQQKRLPCIPPDGCPRRKTVEPRRRRRDIALLTQKRQSCCTLANRVRRAKHQIIAGRFRLASAKFLKTNMTARLI